MTTSRRAAIRPRALDLFCGAGGAAMGLHQAGYEVTGVDIERQPRYLFTFEQGDAFDWLEDKERMAQFDLIWASPKCQAHSNLTPTAYKGNHEMQLPRVLDLLRTQSTPYIVENVAGTQILMRDPIFLCGTMFGLSLWRHRWFEIGNVSAFFLLPPCNHSIVPVVVSGTPRRGGIRKEPCAAARRRALETPWMTRADMDQAIPPAYSRFLAERILDLGDTAGG